MEISDGFKIDYDQLGSRNQEMIMVAKYYVNNALLAEDEAKCRELSGNLKHFGWHTQAFLQYDDEGSKCVYLYAWKGRRPIQLNDFDVVK